MKQDIRAVIIAAAYCLVTASANMLADVFIPLGAVFISLGTIVFPFTFTLRDYAHGYGRRFVYAMIAVAALVNVLMAWVMQVSPSIIVASFVAIIISETADTEIYHALMRRVPWMHRVLASNAISVPLDTLVFVPIAFGLLLELQALLKLFTGEILLKYALSVVSAYAHHVIPPLRELRDLRELRGARSSH